MAQAEAKKSWVKEIVVSVTGSVLILVIQQHLGLSNKPADATPPPAAVKGVALRHLERGKQLLRAGQHGQAAASCTEALCLDPGLAEGYLLRGWAHLCLDQPEQAVRDYTEAIRLDPTSAAAYGNRGWAQGQLGRYEQAVRDCEEALRLHPGLDEVRRVRAWALARGRADGG
jgi:tetratricopeptide (TPR) repeat protein